MNGTTGTQRGPSHPHAAGHHPWAHGDVPAVSILLPSHPGDPGDAALVPAASWQGGGRGGRGQGGTHAMSFRYMKSSRAEERVDPSPALVTFTGTPAEVGREDGQDQLVPGSPRNVTPQALNRCDRYEL